MPPELSHVSALYLNKLDLGTNATLVLPILPIVKCTAAQVLKHITPSGDLAFVREFSAKSSFQPPSASGSQILPKIDGHFQSFGDIGCAVLEISKRGALV